MDSGANVCSQKSVVEALTSTHSRKSSVTEGIETHPFWSAAKAKGLENAPPYTDGPSRIVLANDGTKDCLALLLTPDLVAALNQITRDIQNLGKKDQALKRMDSEIVDLSYKADMVEETIRNPRYQDRAEEMQLVLEILQLTEEEAQEDKGQLNVDLKLLESSLKSSRYQAQGICEEALLAACLIDTPEPESPPMFHDVDDVLSAKGFPDAPSMHGGIEPAPEQQLL